MTGRALVLAAHGSRRDPAANALVRRLAESLRGRRLFDEVAVAFHQGEPGFDTVLDEITADEVTVVPCPTSTSATVSRSARCSRRSSVTRRATSGATPAWVPTGGVCRSRTSANRRLRPSASGSTTSL